jgi:hypothetical protein
MQRRDGTVTTSMTVPYETIERNRNDVGYA